MSQASVKKLEHTGPAKKTRVASMPQREQLASTPEPSLPKGKEQSRLSKAPDHKEGIQCQRSKKNSSKGKKNRRVFLCGRTVRVEVKSKIILELSENSRKGDLRWGEKGAVSRIRRCSEPRF